MALPASVASGGRVDAGAAAGLAVGHIPDFRGTIIQAAPYIERGAGVAGVAFNLEQALGVAGVRTERFTLQEAHGGWIPRPAGGIARKAALFVEVIWFSLIGGWFLRRRLARGDKVIAICHNDALAGDVYVNHGVLKAAMKARGSYLKRIARNPLHPFVLARDAYRYRSSIHRAVVALTPGEKQTLLAAYPRLRAEVVVIPNGVDIERFSPTYDPLARSRTRNALDLADSERVVLFVGHEYERKGLPELMLALTKCSSGIVLVVVGGSPEMVNAAGREAQRIGVSDRVRFVGQVDDPRPYFAACDIFCLPSAYEANALVILEAFAMGLPVVATRVGFAGDIIEDGSNGFLVERDATEIASRISTIADQENETWSIRARATGEAHSWSRVAGDYLSLAARLSASTPTPAN